MSISYILHIVICFILHIVTELWGNNSATGPSTWGIKQANLTVKVGIPDYCSGKWSSMVKWGVIILGHLVSISISFQEPVRNVNEYNRKSTQVSTKWIGKKGKNPLTHSLFSSLDRHIMNIYYMPSPVLCAEFSNMVPVFTEFIV